MTTRITQRDLLGLVFVLLVAALLRFANLGITEWRYDDAALSTRAQEMVEGKTFPTLGIMSSMQIPNPPPSVYVIALSFFLSNNPLFTVGFIALLNVIGVGMLWLLAYRFLSPRIAFIAALIYAMTPWAVVYSRRIWAQEYHTPFIIAGLLIALYGFIDGKRWAQILCLPVLVFGMQIHFSGWALVPVYLWIIWMGRKRISWRALMISVVITLLTLMPFAIGLYQMYESEGTILRQANVIPGRGFQALGIQTAPLRQIIWLTTGTGMDDWYELPDGMILTDQYPILKVLWLSSLIVIGIGFWRFWHQSRAYAVLLVLWGVLPVSIIMPGWVKSETYYYVSSLPAYCLLMGEGVIWLTERKLGAWWLQWLTGGVLGLILVTQVMNWRSVLQTVDKYSLPNFSTPLHYYQDIASLLKDDVLIFGNRYFSYIDWSPVTFRDVRCIRDVIMADGGMALLPQGPFTVMYVPNAPAYEFDDLYNANPQIIPLRVGDSPYIIKQFNETPTWKGPEITPIEATPFDNGAVLNGYTFADHRLYLDWTLALQDQPDYQYFAHVLNSTGERVAQHDASFYPGKYWCNDDRIITWFELERPTDAITLRIGMYHFQDSNIVGNNAYDPAGNATPWIDIPLETVAAQGG